MLIVGCLFAVTNGGSVWQLDPETLEKEEPETLSADVSVEELPDELSLWFFTMKESESEIREMLTEE